MIDVTALLALAAQGDRAASEDLAEALFDELRRVAQGQLRHDRANHTLQATALVNEAWVRLSREGVGRASDRGEFLRHAARAMRNVLCDYARWRGAAKRGGDGGQPIELLEEELLGWRERDVDVLDLELAIERLEERDPELAQLVELRFFAGRSEEEAALVLGKTRRQVQHAWTLARAFLHRELSSASDAETP